MNTRQSDHPGDLLAGYAAGTLDQQQRAIVREHLATCSTCQAELKEWESIGSAVQAGAWTPSPSRGLLDRAFAKIDAEAAVTENGWSPKRLLPNWSLSRQRLIRPVGVALSAAAITAALIFTPAGSFASSLLDVFQPRQFVAVPVSMEDLRSLPSLSEYGTFTHTSENTGRKVSSLEEAEAATGMSLLTPASLPANVPTTVQYGVVPSQTASFTFSAEKARAAAAANGEQLPPMPPNIDGSTLEVKTGAGVIAVYGNADAAELESAHESAKNGAKTVDRANLPKLVIGQAVAPTVTSTGVSADELKDYLLSQPGISPQLANAIRAIGDPATTWPIPIPVSEATSHPVQVQGVEGIAIGDSTGLGSGVLWVKNGIIYGVGGTLTEAEVLQIANSLR